MAVFNLEKFLGSSTVCLPDVTNVLSERVEESFSVELPLTIQSYAPACFSRGSDGAS